MSLLECAYAIKSASILAKPTLEVNIAPYGPRINSRALTGDNEMADNSPVREYSRPAAFFTSCNQ